MLKPTRTGRRSGVRSVDPLGPLETIILEMLWSRSSGTASEITSLINSKMGRELSSKTVLTCLTRLERKGLVIHRREGRTFRFLPAMTPRETSASFIHAEVSEILDHFGELAVTVFVSCLEEYPASLEHLRHLLEVGHEGSNT